MNNNNLSLGDMKTMDGNEPVHPGNDILDTDAVIGGYRVIKKTRSRWDGTGLSCREYTDA